jgi:hypothetical protein
MNIPPSARAPSNEVSFGIAATGSRTGTGLDSLPLGASFIAIALFLLIGFASNAILSSVTLRTLGITVTLSVLIFFGILILILMIL